MILIAYSCVGRKLLAVSLYMRSCRNKLHRLVGLFTATLQSNLGRQPRPVSTMQYLKELYGLSSLFWILQELIALRLEAIDWPSYQYVLKGSYSGTPDNRGHRVRITLYSHIESLPRHTVRSLISSCAHQVRSQCWCLL